MSQASGFSWGWPWGLGGIRRGRYLRRPCHDPDTRAARHHGHRALCQRREHAGGARGCAEALLEREPAWIQPGGAGGVPGGGGGSAPLSRQETLYVTMNAIMFYQQEYFLEGEETKLRPMILKDIADMVGLDISTVSRVANSKYVDTPYGTKLIKEFFSESMTNDQGEEVSTIEIKNILQQVISEEDKKKPLPDDQLAEILKERGYPIARRTIAKYREQLDIPVARLRKKI